MDDQEAGFHRDNIRIFSVKERVEGKNTLSFSETRLPKLLNLERNKGRILLDRCHRGLGRPIPDVPHFVIMTLHYPADKIKIPVLSGNQKLEYEGAWMTIC